MNNDLPNLSSKIGVEFKNTKFIEEALTHRSYVNENKEIQTHNERLEFLGDAVLELVVTEFLFKTYETYPEGDLTSFRAALVKTESLAEEAERLDLGEFILMSKGEEATGGRTRPYILANTVEAIIGAIYLDSGYQASEEFILKHICYKADMIVKSRLDIDSKSKLQEIAQEVVKITPSYEFVSSKGPDHDKIFEMAVLLGDKAFGRGEGKSKQEAEQNAAENALTNWENLIQKYFKN